MDFDKHLATIFSWSQYSSLVNTFSKHEKGDCLERLTQLILITKAEYKSILKNIWWLKKDSIPAKVRKHLNLPLNDEGIDLIAESNSGDFWAIQCKFKSKNETPTYKELSTFVHLSNTYCKNLSLSLLVHTGEKGVRKRKLLGEKYSEIGLDFWLNLDYEDWTNIHKKLKGQSTRPKLRSARPHQQKAIQAAISHYNIAKESRGRLIMPCGTGKSLTAFWIANSLDAKSIIVAVPSLSLIKQTLEDWTKEFLAINETPIPDWLVICGDESTSRLDNDEFVNETYSLGIPTTTNVDEIVTFLKKKHTARKIIFTTYQSSRRLIIAANKLKFKFELAILDESHKTVGGKSKTFSALISDKDISINKRIFMTATERIVLGKNDDVYSMNDEMIYGKRFFQLSFKDAIKAVPQIICDYKILTITVTSREIKNLIDDNKLITDKSNELEDQEAQSIAAAIALRKATKAYGIKHIVSFHKGIKAAEKFTLLNNKLNQIKTDKINLPAFHISSRKSAGTRAQLIDDFKNEKSALITNARCLTEGIDIPTIDCVLFADPKQSIVDIVQAAGRALRPYPGKQFGYIMMPLIVPDNIEIEDFSNSTSFKEVVKIITALSSQDERIVEEFKLLSKEKGSKGKIIIENKIRISVPFGLSDFTKEINAKIWDKLARLNWRSFIEARKFVHTLNLKNIADWKKLSKSKEKPEDIPTYPQDIYKNEGWVSMGDWLGTGKVANKFRKFASFNDASEYVHALNLKSGAAWRKWVMSAKMPFDIPSNPNVIYKNKGWISMGDWLGSGRIAAQLMKYRDFIDAKKYANSLNLKNFSEWKKFKLLNQKPNDIPANPDQTYENKGWISWGDWLGTNVIASRLKQYRSFEEARKFVRRLKLKNNKDWKIFKISENMPVDIPANPDQTYENKGWISWGDWLGTKAISNRLREYRTFEDARKFVRRLNLKNNSEWRQFCMSEKRPANIPSKPNRIYKNCGWISLGDWLGSGTIQPKLREFDSFDKARKFVHSLNLKSETEWRKFCKSKKRPLSIPAKPSRTYNKKGWKGMSDWLGY